MIEECCRRWPLARKGHLHLHVLTISARCIFQNVLVTIHILSLPAQIFSCLSLSLSNFLKKIENFWVYLIFYFFLYFGVGGDSIFNHDWNWCKFGSSSILFKDDRTLFVQFLKENWVFFYICFSGSVLNHSVLFNYLISQLCS